MKKLNDFLETETDQRLLRLFAVGCCRQIWDKLTDERSRTAVEVAERFADSQATKEELKEAHASAFNTAYNSANEAARYTARSAVHYASRSAAYFAARAAYFAANDAAAAREKQFKLYHCIFTKIDLTTTNQNSLNLAKIIYLERNWMLMPILGDALEDDGCPEEVISHCKEKEHARGCWVVDNILGNRHG